MSLQKIPFTTMGVVVDISHIDGLSLAQETAKQTKDKEFSNLLAMAQIMKKRYLIAAGRFNGKGIYGTLCDDEEHLKLSFTIANERMNEDGSVSTTWLIKPHSCAEVLGVKSVIRNKEGH